MTIRNITKLYSKKLDHFDLEVILAHSLGKPREFVLAHPEYKITSNQKSAVIKNIKRRLKGEPIAYITGHKEFYGLDFIVNKHTLIPRPETELLVELAGKEMQNKKHHLPVAIIDIGTGSGNIVISIAKGSESDIKYFATDISKNALQMAKKNAKIHNLDEKINFLLGNLLTPLSKTKKPRRKVGVPTESSRLIIVANLPYLSKEIYSSAPIDVKKYESKSALYSPEKGLQHYRKLLNQIKKLPIACQPSLVTCFFEISPEQKQPIIKLIKNIFSDAKTSFTKNLARRWRVCKISI